MANRMIWPRYTKNFPRFCEALNQMRDGDPSVSEFALGLGNEAQRRMDDLLKDSQGASEEYMKFMELLTPIEISEIRKGEAISDDFNIKIRIAAEILSRSVASKYADNLKYPIDHKSVVNHFAFRHAICYIFGLLEWIKIGSPMHTKIEKIRNDRVDLMFSVYGTYFNGLMTEDKKLDRIYQNSRNFLQIYGATMPSRAC